MCPSITYITSSYPSILTKSTSSRPDKLPIEVIRHILIYLNVSSLLQLSVTCRSFYHLITSDNILWRAMYEHTYTIKALEYDWLLIHSSLLQYFNSKLSASCWENIDWRLALYHRKRTEYNWINDIVTTKHVYQHKLSNSGRFIKFKGPGGFLLVDQETNHLTFSSMLHAGALYPLYYNSKCVYATKELSQSDKGDKIAVFNGYMNAMISHQYVVVIGNMIERDQPMSEQQMLNIGRVQPCKRALHIWSIGNQHMHAMIPTFSNTCLEGIHYQWLLTEVAHTTYSQYGEQQYTYNIYNLNTAQIAWSLQGEYGTMCHIQSADDTSVTVFCAKMTDAPQAALEWQLQRIEQSVADKSHKIVMLGSGIMKLDDKKRMQVIGTAALDEDHILLTCWSSGSSIRHLVVRIEQSKEQDTSHAASSSIFGHQKVQHFGLAMAWSTKFKGKVMSLSDLGLVFVYIEDGTCMLFRLDSGQQVSTYTLHGLSTPQRVLGRLCVAKIEQHVCLFDVVNGKIIRTLNDTQDDLTTMLASSPTCISYLGADACSNMHTLCYSSLSTFLKRNTQCKSM
jgi:hypothetical protein